MSSTAIDASRPSFLVSGTERPQLAAQLLELEAEDSLLGACACRATFNNWGPLAGGQSGFQFFDRSVLDIGKPICVRIPVGGQAAEAFDGFIHRLEGTFPHQTTPVVTCHSRSALHRFRSEPRSRAFRALSSVEVIKAVAREHGLLADVSLLRAARARDHEQRNVTDLEFLLQHARELDAELWIANGRLFVQARATRAAPTVTLTCGNELLEFSGTWGAEATGRLTRGTNPFVTAAGVAGSAKWLRAGERVRIDGAGPLLTGVYYLTRVSCRYRAAEGLRQHFEAERAAA